MFIHFMFKKIETTSMSLTINHFTIFRNILIELITVHNNGPRIERISIMQTLSQEEEADGTFVVSC